MDLAALLERYPQSAHEVSPRAGVRGRTSQDDLKGWIREFFRARGSSGTYVLRMSPGESHNHLYYVQAEVREGITERLWLLLEMPLDLVNPRQPARDNETRYPACNDVLSPLTAKYGKPEALAPYREEPSSLSITFGPSSLMAFPVRPLFRTNSFFRNRVT